MPSPPLLFRGTMQQGQAGRGSAPRCGAAPNRLKVTAGFGEGAAGGGERSCGAAVGPGLAEKPSVKVYELIRMVVPLHQRQL